MRIKNISTKDIPNWYVCFGKVGERDISEAGRTPMEALNNVMKEHEKYGTAKNV